MGWSPVTRHTFNQISPISICKTLQWCLTIREPICTAHLNQFCVMEKILICMTLEKNKEGNGKKGYMSLKERLFMPTEKETPKTKTKPNLKTSKKPKYPKTLDRYRPHPHPSTENRAIGSVWSILIFNSFIKTFVSSDENHN